MVRRIVQIGEEGDGCPGKKKVSLLCLRKTGPSIEKAMTTSSVIRKKVKEAIKNNLPDLVTEESIIMSNGKDVVKIPIRSLDEYKIRYNYDKNKHVGQGDGDSEIGDVVARDGSDSKQGQGKGQGAGDQAGEDYYEAEVSLMDLEEALFRELELPNLKQKELDDIIVEQIEFNDIRKTGLTGNIHKKRTMLSAFKRNAMTGSPSFIQSTQRISSIKRGMK